MDEGVLERGIFRQYYQKFCFYIRGSYKSSLTYISKKFGTIRQIFHPKKIINEIEIEKLLFVIDRLYYHAHEVFLAQGHSILNWKIEFHSEQEIKS